MNGQQVFESISLPMKEGLAIYINNLSLDRVILFGFDTVVDEGVQREQTQHILDGILVDHEQNNDIPAK